jgi:Family of unknown function (DUF6496)
MPADEVMGKFEEGKLHSGSPSGPKVKNRKQAIAIMLDEKRKAAEGKQEYQPAGGPKPARSVEEHIREAAARRKRK